MTSIGSNIASSSGAGSSEGSMACTWFLTLEEHLQNIEHIILSWHPDKVSPYIKFFETIPEVVKELRMDPFGNIETALSLVEDFEGMLPGTTPLHWAVLMNDRKMVNYILGSGKVDINASTTFWKETALSYAIIGGNHEIVEDLRKHNADFCICNSRNESALRHMVFQHYSMFSILKRILANNVNMCDEVKKTALHHATEAGAIDVVAYLLHEKADVNLQDHCGYTPLHYVATKGSLIFMKVWRSRERFEERERAKDIVSLLGKHNVHVNALDKDGRSPLIHSISNGWINTFNALTEIGADVHVKDVIDNNALHIAIHAYDSENNILDIVKYLREQNVDANAKNKQGYSPFFAAVVEGHTEVVEELLQSTKKIKLMEECNGQTAIQIAFDNGLEHIKRLLLEHDDVSRYVENLYRDRQVYVDAANAILVGAALIASVTFASWLQPPLGYTTSYLDLIPSSSDINYVDIQHNVSLRVFWVFNTFSFYFAIGTMVFGARSVLPRQQIFIQKIVDKLHRNLLVTSILLACSVFCVLVAFGIAGSIVITPTLKFQWYMIVPTVLGGLVCLVSLGFLFKSMVEDNLEKKRKEFKLYW